MRANTKTDGVDELKENFLEAVIIWSVNVGLGNVADRADRNDTRIRSTAEIYYTAAERLGAHLDFYITDDMNLHGYSWPHPYHRLVIAVEADSKTMGELETLATELFYDRQAREQDGAL